MAVSAYIYSSMFIASVFADSVRRYDVCVLCVCVLVFNAPAEHSRRRVEHSRRFVICICVLCGRVVVVACAGVCVQHFEDSYENKSVFELCGGDANSLTPPLSGV